AEWREGRAQTRAYWTPHYDESRRGSFAELRAEFRTRVRDAVAAECDGLEMSQVGAFLSGGTDSSTIAGMMSELGRGPVDTYSIGFEKRGWDETRYARCAAERFRPT